MSTSEETPCKLSPEAGKPCSREDSESGSRQENSKLSPESAESKLPEEAANLEESDAEIDEETFGAASTQLKGSFKDGSFIPADHQSVSVPERVPVDHLRGHSSAGAGSHSQASHNHALSATSPAVEIKTLSYPAANGPTGSSQSSEAPSLLSRQQTPLSTESIDKSPVVQHMLNRLETLELSMFKIRDLNTQIGTLRSDVDYLLRAQRQPPTGLYSSHGPPASTFHSPALSTSGHYNSHSPASAATSYQSGSYFRIPPGFGQGASTPTPDDLPYMASQVNSMSGSVDRMMAAQHAHGHQPAASAFPYLNSQQGSSSTNHPTPGNAGRPVSPAVSFATSGSHPRMSTEEQVRLSQSGYMMTPEAMQARNPWASLSAILAPTLYRSLMALPGLNSPSKIQLKAIPLLLVSREDIVAETSNEFESVLSYGLPAIQTCHNSPSASGGVTCLIITATTERASQAQRLIHHLGAPLGVRTSIAVSPSAADDQAMLARMRPHALVATPRNALDLLASHIIGSEGSIRLTVIDEADQIVLSGQSEIVDCIMRLLPSSQHPDLEPESYDPWADTSGKASSRSNSDNADVRQTALFANAVPQGLLDWASALGLRAPVRVLMRKGTSSSSSAPSTATGQHHGTATAAGATQPTGLSDARLKSARHFYLYVALSSDRAWKLESLVDLIEDASAHQAVVFCASLEAVETVAFKLASHSIDALAVHDDMGPAARSSVLAKFRNAGGAMPGSKKVLVVCDRLGRTVPDLHQVPLITNFDLPANPENYIYHCQPAMGSGYNRPASVVNMISTDADIEHLRRIEAYFGVRMLELPHNLAAI